LQVGSVKALREPAVDRCQELVGLGALTLLLPQATQAHGGAQLPGFGLLAAGNGQGLLEAGFGFQVMGRGAREQQLPLQPIDLRLIDTVFGLLHEFQRFGDHGQPLFRLVAFAIRLG
jgi:hypothetical protein